MKVGHVVRLKSGGPAMTILSFMDRSGENVSSTPTDYVRCAWFTDEGEPKSALFLVVALNAAREDEWQTRLPRRSS